MPVQIDHMETSLEIVPAPEAAPAQGAGQPTRAAGTAIDVRDAVVKILADELDQFARMRGHS